MKIFHACNNDMEDHIIQEATLLIEIAHAMKSIEIVRTEDNFQMIYD